MLEEPLLNQEEPDVKLSELKSLSTKQLRDVVTNAQNLLEERRHTEIQEGRAKVQAMAEELGISIHDLLGLKDGKPKTASGRAPAKPKYRSRKNPELTWTGKGRMAAWLQEEMDATGKDKEHFLIKD